MKKNNQHSNGFQKFDVKLVSWFFFQFYPMYVFFWKIILKVWISGTNNPWIFFILCEYIDNLYTYLNMLQKIFTKILMGFKILCQVEDFWYFFKITLCTCVFEKSCLMGRVDGWDGISKVSFNFLHNLWVYRLCIYLLIYEIKIITKIPMGFKIWCEAGGRGQKFQNYQR